MLEVRASAIDSSLPPRFNTVAVTHAAKQRSKGPDVDSRLTLRRTGVPVVITLLALFSALAPATADPHPALPSLSGVTCDNDGGVLLGALTNFLCG